MNNNIHLYYILGFTWLYIMSSNSLIVNLSILATGIYIGQEYTDSVPNIKQSTIKLYKYFKTTDFYKELNNDNKKK